MEILLAVVLGALVGVLGFVPTFMIAGRARKALVVNNNSTKSLGLLLGSIGISFVIMAVAIVVCSKVAHDVVFPFVIALVVGLSGSAIVCGLKLSKK